MRFSEHFKLKKTQGQLDFVDIKLNADLPLYLDPYALTTRHDIWSVECHQTIISFFSAVLECVHAGNRSRGTALMSKLNEPRETHLGVAKPDSEGRGIGETQAAQLFEAMSRSAAAKTGLLEDLGDFALFIPGIGRDKVSDITTNVIRRQLIAYTQAQCRLHGVPMRTVASGFWWNVHETRWAQNYVELPIANDAPILLVPKYTVRYRVGVDSAHYRSHFVLEFLKDEHLRADDALVTTIRNKKGMVSKRVYKKDVDAHYSKDKDFLAQFSKDHPEVIERYRLTLKRDAAAIPALEPGDGITEPDLAAFLSTALKSIMPGRESADDYHSLMIGILSFIFFPNLIYPQKEAQINQGRKRIDITYTNGKVDGFFFRIASDPDVKANVVHVECKNYSSDIANEELDQLLGRFDKNRGKLGLMLFRAADDTDRVFERCRDAAKQGLGIVLPVDDTFVLNALGKIEHGARSAIDRDVDQLYRSVTS